VGRLRERATVEEVRGQLAVVAARLHGAYPETWTDVAGKPRRVTVLPERAKLPSERASIQGLADLFMGLMGAFGSAAGGMILGIWGFAILNVVGAVLTFGPLAFTLLRRPTLAAASLRAPLL
jgi:hypothetical protein